MVRLFLLCLFAFGLIAWAVESGAAEVWDVRMMLLVHSVSFAELTAVLRLLSAIFQGELVTVYTLLFVAWLLLCARRQAVALMVLLTMMVTGAVNELAKNLFARIRPDFFRLAEADGFSFPSAHAMHTFVFMGLLGWFVWHSLPSQMGRVTVAGSVTLIVLFTGFSRIYLGVHYPSDIVGGYLLGAAILLIALGFFSFRKKDLQFRAEER
jgi:undecaprenyl-diphosphatase